MTNTKPPIIVIKKKGGHGGHHGGAWKVAYADFVTAMMALFIVLWLLNTSKPVKDAVAGYFKDPAGTSKNVGTSVAGTGEKILLSHDNMSKLKDKLEKAIKQMPNFEKLKKHIVMTITSEGLRIELTESASGTFFDIGSPNLNTDGKDLIVLLAQELGKLPNKLALEGHTDSTPYAEGRNYGNWELSADRANSSRRLMQQNGVGSDQITQVRGFADQRLLKPDAPKDPANRRISLIVLYQQDVAADDKSASPKLDSSVKEVPDADVHKDDSNADGAHAPVQTPAPDASSQNPKAAPDTAPRMSAEDVRKAVLKMNEKTKPPADSKRAAPATPTVAPEKPHP